MHENCPTFKTRLKLFDNVFLAKLNKLMYTFNMIKFQERLKELREEKGLTRAQLAKILNVTPRMVAFWETNERMCSVETLILLSRALNASTDYLLGLTDF